MAATRTNVVDLAESLFQRIEWQKVPEDMTQEDLTVFIANAIRTLYVMTGRALQFSEDMFTKEYGQIVSFDTVLPLDEREYVLVTATLEFYRKVQTHVNDLVSYTTDAMSVSHGDKPFANLQQSITNLSSLQRQIWYKMPRYHLL